MPRPTDALVASCVDDLGRGLGVPRPLRRVVAPWAMPFVRDILAMDAAIGRSGLGGGADTLLPTYSGEATFSGPDLPATGPLLVVANHPGTVDVPLLWRALAARDDVRIIALDRDFLRAVPHLAAQLLYVEDAPRGRTDLVRRAAAHLREGGALLTFPAGDIEPDPALRPDAARAALRDWTRSPELFVRLAPETTVVPVAVSGVIARRFLRHPLARVRRRTEDAELTAATLQVVLRDTSIRPHVAVGEPMRGASGLTDRLREAMVALLESTRRT